MKIIILFVIFTLAACNSGNIKTESGETKQSAQSASQKRVSLEQYCASNPCRQNQVVKFNTDQGEVDQLLPVYWPAVMNDQISVLPGEELFVEADIIDGKLVNLKQVKDITNPGKTLILKFMQPESGVSMMLSVKNPFDQTIKYHIDMIDFRGNPHQTSSCPVMAGISAFESWPHPIPELKIHNFRVMNGNSLMCVY